MHILLLEDDRTAATHILVGMAELGHVVRWVQTDDDAARELAETKVDIAILGRADPGLDGLATVRRIRAAGCDTPILMLTALGELEHRVEGLEAGADDCLSKPYAFVELATRIHALGRRSRSETNMLQVGDIRMNLMRREVWRGDRRIDLQPRGFRLLEQLLRHADRVVTKTMLLGSVWDFDFDPKTSVVETQISRLRLKLNDGFDSDAIKTVRGAGYVIQAHSRNLASG